MKLTQILALCQSIILLQNGRLSASKVECIKPDPDPPSSSSDCHTLNEIVEHSKCYIQNGTYIRLLPGVHHINSTGHSITTENVHSSVLTGDRRNDHSMSRRLPLRLYRYRRSNLTFSFCELSFSNYKRNLIIDRVSITDRRLLLPVVLYISTAKWLTIIMQWYILYSMTSSWKSPVKTTRKFICLLFVFRDQCWLLIHKKSIVSLDL